jgi:antitoxin ParD1/3/4
MKVTLKPELEKLIEDDVKSGRSIDPNEFLSKAVYHYILARELGEAYTAEEIDQMISDGLEDIQRGDTIEGEEAFRQLRARNAERRQRRT